MIKEMLDSLDSGDIDVYVGYFAPDGMFRFGNLEPVKGRQAIADSCASFTSLIKGLRHRVLDSWSVSDVTILKTEVDYVRLDLNTATVPLAIIITRHDGLVTDYAIYGDVSPVFDEIP